ncbi:MPPV-117 virion core proteinase [Magpiepox virus 2]|nr:virion core proteinase [Magpiepox virus]QZW33411.1 MPPV-117 virion core proteinase [Magpiepox virus 2]
MDRYTELVINKIPELGFVNLLSHIYQTVGLSYDIDVSKFKTNCNGYVVERFDNSETAGKVSCVPISILLELVDRKILSKPDTSKTEIDIKEDLVNELIENTNGFEDIMTIPTSIPMRYFFKPVLREKVSKAVDFSRMDIKGDDISKMGIKHGEKSNNISNIKIVPEKDAWMTNTSIQQLIGPMSYGTEVSYIGQFNFNFINTYPVYEKSAALNRSPELFKIKDRIKGLRTRFVMFGFCYMFHWKCLIYDRESDFVCFYDSGGSNPYDFDHYDNFFYYSHSRGFNKNSRRSSSLSNENADIDILFNFFVDNYEVTSGCINVEVNQLMESECGMFTSLFMTMCCLHPPKGFKGIRKTYTYFKFLADKKMTMLKSILFNADKMEFKVKESSSKGIQEYKKMEEWCGKTINILADKITTRVNSIIE